MGGGSRHAVELPCIPCACICYLHQCVLFLAVDAHQYYTSQGPVRSLSANHDVRVGEKNPMKYLNTVHGGGGGGRGEGVREGGREERGREGRRD